MMTDKPSRLWVKPGAMDLWNNCGLPGRTIAASKAISNAVVDGTICLECDCRACYLYYETASMKLSFVCKRRKAVIRRNLAAASDHSKRYRMLNVHATPWRYCFLTR
jgi:hypothetical protein